MRVIAGKARRIQLTTVEGMSTRPTTDRIKETLFNMINQELYDCNFLDLFAGSGAIGIEALSRGARSATFVENNPNAIRCIRDNLFKTKLESANILEVDVISGLNMLEKQGKKFDIIFMDPPYNHLIEQQVLERLNQSSLLHEDTMIIVEASLDTSYTYIENLNYTITKVKKYKTNMHIYLKPNA